MLFHNLTVVLLLATGCFASKHASDVLLDILKETQVNDAENECKAIPPSRPRVVNTTPNGATVLFQWLPKGSANECTRGVLVLLLYRSSDDQFLGSTIALTTQFRGLVFRNLTSNTVYKLEAVSVNGTETSAKMILLFNTASVLKTETTENDMSYAETMNTISNVLAGADRTSDSEPQCDKLTPPTNGRVTQVANNSATLQFDWKHKEGDCQTIATVSLLHQKTGNGRKLQTLSVSAPPYYVRGQFYANLDRDTEYFTESYTAGEDNTRSAIITTAFRTKK